MSWLTPTMGRFHFPDTNEFGRDHIPCDYLSAQEPVANAIAGIQRGKREIAR